MNTKLIILLLISSCISHQLNTKNPELLYITTSYMQPVHQCANNLPLFYMIDDNISPELYKIIEDSFEYWDNLSNKKLFVKIDYDKEVFNSLGGVLKIKLSELPDFVYGSTHVKYNEKTGCMLSSNLDINKDIIDLPINTQHNIIRHEVGHILGFDHSDDPEALMFYLIGRKKELKNILEGEYKAFSIYY